jgi:enoyl-CoA hydratase
MEDEPYDDLKVTLEDGVGVITIDRPPVNAFSTTTYEELHTAMSAFNDDPACVVLVIRSGNLKIFCAGADVKELPMTPEKDTYRMGLVRKVFDLVLGASQPVICAVRGPALGGGCGLAAACDIRLASESASFGLPEINVGRGGGARYLMRVLPQGTARRAYFTGKPIPATEAYRLGMVAELTSDEPGALEESTMALAAEIASKSPLAVRYAKESLDLAEAMGIAEGYHVEQQFTLRLATSNDAAEAAAAFKEKRPPVWTGT